MEQHVIHWIPTQKTKRALTLKNKKKKKRVKNVHMFTSTQTPKDSLHRGTFVIRVASHLLLDLYLSFLRQKPQFLPLPL